VDNFYRPSLILCAQFFVSMITDLWFQSNFSSPP
jgi:hypothetical protein